MARVAQKKPETEIRLTELQDTYLVNRDELTWKLMFDIMIHYARSLTLKTNKGKVYLEPDHITAVATDAAIKIMERYKKEESFKIDRSFGGLLRWKVVESLYGNYQEDIHQSLNHIISEDDGHSTELGDLQDKIGFTPLYNHHIYEPDYMPLDYGAIQATITRILEEFDEEIHSNKLRLLGRAYLLLHIRKPKIRQAANLFKKNLQISPQEETILDLLLLEMHNRIRHFI